MMAEAAVKFPTRGERRVIHGLAGGALAVIVAGLVLKSQERELGTATPPFVMAFDPRLSPYALLALLLLGAFALAAPKLLRAPRSTAAFALTSFGVALTANLAVGAMRRGPEGWFHVFDLGPNGSFEAKNEYLPGLPALRYGTDFFLDRFAEMVPALPVNVGAHPPGLMLVMHGMGVDTPAEMAALCIAAAALCTPLSYAVARNLLDEPRARVAALLTALCPLVLVFGTTSADAVYAAVGLLAAGLLSARSGRVRALGCVIFALGTLGSWALLAIGAWAAIIAWQREGLLTAVRLGASCGVAVAVLDGALALAFGYDALGTLRATEALYRNSLASIRPYEFWLLGSPVAWGVMLGLPLTAGLAVAGLRRQPAAIAILAVILVAAVMGFTKAETERIWLLFAPLACVAVAAVLPPRRLVPVLGWLVAQVLVVEALFDTVW